MCLARCSLNSAARDNLQLPIDWLRPPQNRWPRTVHENTPLCSFPGEKRREIPWHKWYTCFYVSYMGELHRKLKSNIWHHKMGVSGILLLFTSIQLNVVNEQKAPALGPHHRSAWHKSHPSYIYASILQTFWPLVHTLSAATAINGPPDLSHYNPIYWHVELALQEKTQKFSSECRRLGEILCEEREEEDGIASVDSSECSVNMHTCDLTTCYTQLLL